jgi:hypothetical protein
MSTPLGGVTPTGSAFQGGTITPAANPVSVGGSFGGVGAQGFPTPAAGQIANARNNSGSNVRIPYARLVPMRPKSNGPDQTILMAPLENSTTPGWGGIPGVSTTLGGRALGNEYDGLESGELAWILGRRFMASDLPGAAAGTALADNASLMTAMSASAHGLGMGFGPDRMQRLAYTHWIESFFRAMFGPTAIALHKLNVTSEVNKFVSSSIKQYEPYTTGSSALSTVDVPHLANALFSGTVAEQLQYSKLNGAETAREGEDAPKVRGDAEEGFQCGLFVMEKGPFLRGKMNDADVVKMVDPLMKGTNSGSAMFHNVQRNLGDTLAFEALYATMRSKQMFDWTPDGMVLSKLESPSGDPLSSAELDARQAQLFNIALQGPAIAKTWTGNPKMAALPMDRVFVVMVADVVSTIGAAGTGIGAPAAETKAAWEAYEAYITNGKTDTLYNTYTTARQTANGRMVDQRPAGESGRYSAAVLEAFRAGKLSATAGDAAMSAGGKVAYDNAVNEMDEFYNELVEADFATAANAVRVGEAGIDDSVMTNFRLMRCTSSFLSQYSAAQISGGKIVNGGDGRCGLRIGTNKDSGKPVAGDSVAAEYIIGGWCVGTVLDSAASRSTIGAQTRTAPCSMALNINVNVEWWSGDKLHRHYMDTDGSVLSRGALPNDQVTALMQELAFVKLPDMPEFKLTGAPGKMQD